MALSDGLARLYKTTTDISNRRIEDSMNSNPAGAISQGYLMGLDVMQRQQEFAFKREEAALNRELNIQKIGIAREGLQEEKRRNLLGEQFRQTQADEQKRQFDQEYKQRTLEFDATNKIHQDRVEQGWMSVKSNVLRSDEQTRIMGEEHEMARETHNLNKRKAAGSREGKLFMLNSLNKMRSNIDPSSPRSVTKGYANLLENIETDKNLTPEGRDEAKVTLIAMKQQEQERAGVMSSQLELRLRDMPEGQAKQEVRRAHLAWTKIALGDMSELVDWRGLTQGANPLDLGGASRKVPGGGSGGGSGGDVNRDPTNLEKLFPEVARSSAEMELVPMREELTRLRQVRSELAENLTTKSVPFTVTGMGPAVGSANIGPSTRRPVKRTPGQINKLADTIAGIDAKIEKMEADIRAKQTPPAPQ